MTNKPLVHVREYHYWSERLVSAIADDNVDQSPKRTDVRLGPSFASIGVQGQDPPRTKATAATQVEQLLADLTVTDLDYDGPVQYLAGCSDFVLSSLRYPSGDDTGAVNLFMEQRSPEGRRIAICLFGSARNVCGFAPEVPAWRKFGWTSSHNAGVDLLIQAGREGDDSEHPTSAWTPDSDISNEICYNAVNISFGQGHYHNDSHESWHRGYTLGRFADAEWLARIYHRKNDMYVGGEGFDAVYVGAALWVRTSMPDAWIPYTPETIPTLDADRFPRVLRPLSRMWCRRRGRHRHHLPRL